MIWTIIALVVLLIIGSGTKPSAPKRTLPPRPEHRFKERVEYYGLPWNLKKKRIIDDYVRDVWDP